MSTESVTESDDTDVVSKPGEDEQYCPECGEIILQKADVCPECGVSIDSSDGGIMSLGGGGYLLLGGLISPFAIGFPLIVLIPIYCGIRIYHDHSTRWGLAMGVWGGLTLIATSYVWITAMLG